MFFTKHGIRGRLIILTNMWHKTIKSKANTRFKINKLTSGCFRMSNLLFLCRTVSANFRYFVCVFFLCFSFVLFHRDVETYSFSNIHYILNSINSLDEPFVLLE